MTDREAWLYKRIMYLRECMRYALHATEQFEFKAAVRNLRAALDRDDTTAKLDPICLGAPRGDRKDER